MTISSLTCLDPVALILDLTFCPRILYASQSKEFLVMRAYFKEASHFDIRSLIPAVIRCDFLCLALKDLIGVFWLRMLRKGLLNDDIWSSMWSKILAVSQGDKFLKLRVIMVRGTDFGRIRVNLQDAKVITYGGLEYAILVNETIIWRKDNINKRLCGLSDSRWLRNQLNKV